MAEASIEKRWKITATVDTALCIGDSGVSDTSADTTTVKTSDGRLYIPASTLKGTWRHACEAIARGQEHFVCNSPRAETMCAEAHCVVCQLFGAPTLAAKIFLSDLVAATELAAQSTEIRNGVTLNRQRRTAEEQRLYFTETSLSHAGIAFSGDVTLANEVTEAQIELLKAGLQAIHAIGTGKSRGLGWLNIEIEREEKEAFDAGSSIEPALSEGFTELAIEVTLQSPMTAGGRKPTGQAVEAVQYVRGGLIRGAIAKAWLAAPENGEPDADFQQLFLSDEGGIFRNCYPAANVLPATAVGCKDFPGFLSEGVSEAHGIFDTLLEQLASEHANWLVSPNCPHCGGRVEAQTGFYAQRNDATYERKTVNTRLLTRVAINRHRKVAEEGLLYHLTAIDTVVTESGTGRLHGSARVPSRLASRVAETLQKQVHRLGGGTSRGLGCVHVKVQQCEHPDALAQRIRDFNALLQEIWEAYRHLPSVEMETLESTYFSIDLQADTLLTAEDGWQRSMVLNAPMLQQITGCDTPVKLVRSFASYDYVSGWNAAWGLPKETALVTRMGSVFVFHTPDIDAWMPVLKTLEEQGIGARREEGFGQMLVCAPFHLRTRTKVKCAAHWLGNAEESK